MNGLQSLTQWEVDWNQPHTINHLMTINSRDILTTLRRANSVCSMPFKYVTLVHRIVGCSPANLQNIGALAGYPFAPYMADGIGRKPTIFFGALIMVIATAVRTASQSFGMFIGAR